MKAECENIRLFYFMTYSWTNPNEVNTYLCFEILLFVAAFKFQFLAPSVWIFAGPLLGLAFVSNGLQSKKIISIDLIKTTKELEVERVGIMGSKIISIPLSKLSVQLKEHRTRFGVKPKLEIYHDGKLLDSMVSSLVNPSKKIKALYEALKVIVKAMQVIEGKNSLSTS